MFFEFFTKIDKLTNSLIEVQNGKTISTVVKEIDKSDLKNITKKNGWNFDWKFEFKNENKKVYKLLLSDSKTIQGLVSLEDDANYIYMALIETAPHNYGRNKKYFGVMANLVAYACKYSFEKGYDGVVGFTSKTNLITHYKKELGATQIGGQKMAIFSQSAKKLVSLYFKDFKF